MTMKNNSHKVFDKITNLTMLMLRCYKESKRSPDKRKQVGAIIFNDRILTEKSNDYIITTGYNAKPIGVANYEVCVAPNGCSEVDLLHAEERAIIRAGLDKSKGNAIMVTSAPCKRCSARIIEAQIKTVYYNEDHDNGEGIRYLNDNHIKTIHIPVDTHILHSDIDLSNID